MSIQEIIKQKLNKSIINIETTDIFSLRENVGNDKIVIGIIGSREYQDATKVRKFIYKLKNELCDKLIIVSGGQRRGADGFAKKYALEFKVDYVEFPPAHYPYNQYCILPAHCYNKEYRPYYFFQRNTQIAEFSDKIVAFIPYGTTLEKSQGTNDTCKKAKKLNKKILVSS